MSLMIFYRDKCPYCMECFHYIDELKLLEKYKNIQIKFVNEVKEAKFANQFDYFFVPAIYINEKKAHEGAIGYHNLKKLFDEALND